MTTHDPFYPWHPGYQVVCDDCGDIYAPYQSARDARIRMHRHLEMAALGLLER